MPPPKDRLAAMKKSAGDDDDFSMPMDEDMEGPMKDFFKEVEETGTKISASADGGPRSRVCARETLHSAPHRH